MLINYVFNIINNDRTNFKSDVRRLYIGIIYYEKLNSKIGGQLILSVNFEYC